MRESGVRESDNLLVGDKDDRGPQYSDVGAA